MVSPLLRVIGLRKEFVNGDDVVRGVDDVSFATDRGEITLVMGPSGSGKTTLLTMIGALLRPTAGQVFIDGVDITAIERRRLPAVRRSSIGFVFQTFNLLESLSAQENVELALNVGGVSGPEAAHRAQELLAAGGLADRLHARTRDLSGGEKQRVSIARALANRPPLLLADEPTANLDTANGRAVMELLTDLAQANRTAVVVVSHDGRLANLADQVLWLEDGRLSDRGCGDLDDARVDRYTRWPAGTSRARAMSGSAGEARCR
jgi:putative ABC transport system ATP-binding protein